MAFQFERPRNFLFKAEQFVDLAPRGVGPDGSAAFMDTLRELESSTGNFRFVPTFTRVDNASGGWKGETGHISPEMLSRHVSNLEVPICYVAGPSTMVSAARLTLRAAGVDEDDIRTKEFAGY